MHRARYTGAIAIAAVATGATQVVGTEVAGAAYNGAAAAAYANSWWNSTGRSYFSDDCSDFVSQSLNAGGLAPIYGSPTDVNVWYLDSGTPNASSLSWSVAGDLKTFLGGSSKYGTPLNEYPITQAPPIPNGWLLGDPVFYSWHGNTTIDHTAIKSGIADSSYSGIDQHTVPLFYSTTPYTYAGLAGNPAPNTTDVYTMNINGNTSP